MKPITAMYTNAKVDGQAIKLILDSVDCAASARIITANGTTKTPIGEIDNFPIEVNGIIVPIKVLVMEATQYQAFIVPAICEHFKTTTTAPLIEFEKKEKKPIWEVYQVSKEKKKTSHKKIPPTKLPVAEKVSIQLTPDQNHLISHSRLHLTKTTEHRPITIANHATVNAITTQNAKTSGTINHVLLMANNCSMKRCETTFLVEKKSVVMGWSNKLMDSKGEQDCKVMEIIKGKFNFKERIE
ncbi:hypothetical protein G9A89_020623 [Geosiphon pyriformis]|nr:hypothetical protein G9A89_020623 [Geosiphon pyriformis]